MAFSTEQKKTLNTLTSNPEKFIESFANKTELLKPYTKEFFQDGSGFYTLLIHAIKSTENNIKTQLIEILKECVENNPNSILEVKSYKVGNVFSDKDVNYWFESKEGVEFLNWILNNQKIDKTDFMKEHTSSYSKIIRTSDLELIKKVINYNKEDIRAKSKIYENLIRKSTKEDLLKVLDIDKENLFDLNKVSIDIKKINKTYYDKGNYENCNLFGFAMSVGEYDKAKLILGYGLSPSGSVKMKDYYGNKWIAKDNVYFPFKDIKDYNVFYDFLDYFNDKDKFEILFKNQNFALEQRSIYNGVSTLLLNLLDNPSGVENIKKLITKLFKSEELTSGNKSNLLKYLLSNNFSETQFNLSYDIIMENKEYIQNIKSDINNSTNILQFNVLGLSENFIEKDDIINNKVVTEKIIKLIELTNAINTNAEEYSCVFNKYFFNNKDCAAVFLQREKISYSKIMESFFNNITKNSIDKDKYIETMKFIMKTENGKFDNYMVGFEKIISSQMIGLMEEMSDIQIKMIAKHIGEKKEFYFINSDLAKNNKERKIRNEFILKLNKEISLEKHMKILINYVNDVDTLKELIKSWGYSEKDNYENFEFIKSEMFFVRWTENTKNILNGLFGNIVLKDSIAANSAEYMSLDMLDYVIEKQSIQNGKNFVSKDIDGNNILHNIIKSSSFNSHVIGKTIEIIKKYPNLCFEANNAKKLPINYLFAKFNRFIEHKSAKETQELEELFKKVIEVGFNDNPKIFKLIEEQFNKYPNIKGKEEIYKIYEVKKIESKMEKEVVSKKSIKKNKI